MIEFWNSLSFGQALLFVVVCVCSLSTTTLFLGWYGKSGPPDWEHFYSKVDFGTVLWSPLIITLGFLFSPLGVFFEWMDDKLANPFNKTHLDLLILFSPVLSLLLLWVV